MKKILALILAALMVLTMFACAAKTEPAKEAEQTTTTEPAEETTPEETAPAAEETTEEPAVGGTISVFATSYTDAKLEVFQEIINDFMAETGVQVDLITPGSEGEAQLKTMMASNSLPDVWMTHGWSLLRYSEYLKVVNDQPWFDSIDKDSLAGVMADENGNFYALGMSMSISGLIYNKDALDKAGVAQTPSAPGTISMQPVKSSSQPASPRWQSAAPSAATSRACSAPLPRPSGRMKAPSMIWATL